MCKEQGQSEQRCVTGEVSKTLAAVLRSPGHTGSLGEQALERCLSRGEALQFAALWEMD